MRAHGSCGIPSTCNHSDTSLGGTTMSDEERLTLPQ